MQQRVAAIYARVSTGEQTTENQIHELKAVAVKSDWIVHRVYEETISGGVRREQRPAFVSLLRDARARQFDVVMAWSVDRLGRSLQDLVVTLDDLRDMRVDLYLHRQGVDTTTPVGRAMFGMLGVFAEFERSMIRERVVSGMERAKRAGKHCGRPRVDEARERAFLDALAEGSSVRAAARLAGIGGSAARRLSAGAKGA